ncbi:MAG: PLD nuclease N-terminal domain-containing protein, partial [Acidimicrobiia bacterium]
IGFIVVALWIWALIDCISTDRELIRNLPKGVWLIVVIILFDLGAILWLLLGRPANKHWRANTGPADYSSPRRPRGVEDRPQFSASDVTDRRSEELNRRLAAWEAAQKPADDDDNTNNG